jgi:tetraacyldisaccharide 4'-kinase
MLKFFLYPFSVMYDIVTRLRNTLYDRGLKPSVAFDLPVISVGNLSVGGTGKTPMIEYLVRLLSSDYQVATLSRGYGRNSRGFILAATTDNADTIGDEPLQYLRKFGSRIAVAVGEERALAIPMLLHEREDLDLILLDDAFQHRKVRPSFQILLTDYHRPFFSDFLLPSGRLRESSTGALRADLIVVTKCPPEMGEDAMMQWEKRIRETAEKPVFFSTISYGTPVPFEQTSAAANERVILVSGIASANLLAEHVRKHFDLVEHLEYPDHYQYTRTDLETILRKVAGKDVSVLTTEKDMVKLDADSFRDLTKKISFFYLPITVQFLKHGAEFDEIILNHIRSLDKKTSESDRQPS